jgi:hypothetical protein
LRDSTHFQLTQLVFGPGVIGVDDTGGSEPLSGQRLSAQSSSRARLVTLFCEYQYLKKQIFSLLMIRFSRTAQRSGPLSEKQRRQLGEKAILTLN